MDKQEMITYLVAAFVLLIMAGFFSILLMDNLAKEKILIANGFKDDEVKKTCNPHEIRKRKPLKITGEVLSWTILAVLVVVLAFSVVQRIAYGKRSLFNMPTIASVGSGSMEEINTDNLRMREFLENPDTKDDIRLTYQFPHNGLVVIHPVTYVEDAANPGTMILDISPMDVVAYLHATADVVVIHRVTRVLAAGEKENPESTTEPEDQPRRFITQGDNNTRADIPRVTEDRIMGVYKGENVPLLGGFILFMQAPIGIIASVTCIYLVITADLLRNKYNKYLQARWDALAGPPAPDPKDEPKEVEAHEEIKEKEKE